jgi:hypothetical protein
MQRPCTVVRVAGAVERPEAGRARGLELLRVVDLDALLILCGGPPG